MWRTLERSGINPVNKKKNRTYLRPSVSSSCPPPGTCPVGVFTHRFLESVIIHTLILIHSGRGALFTTKAMRDQCSIYDRSVTNSDGNSGDHKTLNVKWIPIYLNQLRPLSLLGLEPLARRQEMAIIARYRRYLSPPPSPSPWRPSQTADLTELLPSNAHLRASLPRTNSDDRRQELAKQLARDDEPISIASSGGEDANYLLAKAVVGRYAESYLPTIREHQVVLERGVEVVEESLRGRRGKRKKGKDGLEPALSSLVNGVEAEWMIWSRITPPAVALYAWWVVFAIWRKLDDGERDFLAQFTTNRDKVETWLTWAFVGLAAVLCILALAVWAVVEAVRVFSDYRLDSSPGEGDKCTD